MHLTNTFFEQPFSLLDAFFNPNTYAADQTEWSRYSPRFERTLTDDAAILQSQLPGMKPDDLEISVEGNTLTVKGKRDTELPEGVQVLRRERSGYSFTRRFDLGTAYDGTAVEASMELGILRITVPKRPEAKPRQIKISS